VSSDEKAAALLEEYAKIIHDADIFEDIATRRRAARDIRRERRAPLDIPRL